VQDGASQLAVLALKVEKGQEVLDLCAAPGGKSVFAAYLGGNVTACDLYEHKIGLIENNAARLGVRVKAMVNDACVFNEDFENKFQRVIVDAPCSGLGIIRRKPDIKWTKTEIDSGELAKIQQSILNNAAMYVSGGGRLVYSTCTVSKAENEGIAKWFLKNHPDFSPVPLGAGPEPESAYIQLRPDLHGTDGFFMAAFERNGI
ncbi:MAG: SAM-dependent methyltransferase, partial [Clostridia bacterium]